MKVIKPKRLGLLFEVVERQRTASLTVTLLVCFPFREPRRFLYEASLWTMAARELGEDGVLDELHAKPRGEVLVTGSCFTPRGEPRRSCRVRVRLGPVDKSLDVVGDRHWGPSEPSEPVPFTELPVAWTRAFGGPTHAPNPLGKGAEPRPTRDGPAQPLPNVEDPRRPVRSREDRPPPAGLDTISPTWPQRSSKLGTYDEAWRRADAPGYARDLDPTFFNTAPPDQQVEGFFRGDEAFLVENMHPEEPRLEGALPGVRGRCFLAGDGDGAPLREVAMRLETVRLFPHRERGVLVFRGVADVREHDARDVAAIVVGLEAMGEPKLDGHYAEVLAARLDRQAARDVATEDDDLMPWPEETGEAPLPDDLLSGTAALLRRDRPRGERAAPREGARVVSPEVEAMRPDLEARGVDVDRDLASVPRAAPPPAPAAPARPTPDDDPEPPEVAAAIGAATSSLAERGVDAARFFAVEPGLDAPEMDDASVAAADAHVAAVAREQGFDLDALLHEGRASASAAPPVAAPPLDAQLDALDAAAAKAGVSSPELAGLREDPELRVDEAELAAAWAGAARPTPEDAAGAAPAADGPVLARDAEAYALFAGYFPAASRLTGSESARLREEVVAARREGRSLAGRELTGADLSGLDLSGADLSGALLDSAVLADANLAGADLSRAVLAHADLARADLRGAKLVGADLSSASLHDVEASPGVDLSDALLVKADLSGAHLAGAELSSADLSGARLRHADLSGASAKRATFADADFADAVLRGARFESCTFLRATLAGVDLAGACLRSSTFVCVVASGAVLRAADLRGIAAVDGSSFHDAVFRDASMSGANLAGCGLARCDLGGADLRGALLDEADLSGATLDGAILVDATLTRANLSGASLYAADLMGSILRGANARGACFEKASLFMADTTAMIGDSDTSFAGANLKRVLGAGGGGDGPR